MRIEYALTSEMPVALPPKHILSMIALLAGSASLASFACAALGFDPSKLEP